MKKQNASQACPTGGPHGGAETTAHIIAVTLRGVEHYVKHLTTRHWDNKKLVDYTPNKNEAHAFTTLAVANHTITTIFNPNDRTFTAIPHQVPAGYFDEPAGDGFGWSREMEKVDTYQPINRKKYNGRNGMIIQ